MFEEKRAAFRVLAWAVIFSLVFTVLQSGSPQKARAAATLTIWHSYQGGELDALNQDITNAQSSFPDLTITVEFREFSVIFSDYETAVQEGGGPDLLIGPNDVLPEFIETGVVKDLTTDLTGNLDHISQQAVEGMTYQGKIYGVPESEKHVVLFYNRITIPTPPANTDQLLAMLQSGKTLTQMNNAYHLYGWWSAFGTGIFNEQMFCAANSTALAGALEFLRDTQAAGGYFGEADPWGEFESGNRDMIIDGNWGLKEFEDALGNKLGVAPMPSGPAGPARPMQGIDGVYINPNSANYSDALGLALFLTNQASSQIFTDIGGHVPVRDDVTITDPLVAAFYQSAANTLTRPNSIKLGNYWTPFGDAIIALLDGSQSPAQASSVCSVVNRLNGFPFLFLPTVRK